MNRKRRTYVESLELALSKRRAQQTLAGLRRAVLLEHKINEARAMKGDHLLREPLRFWAEEMLCRTDRKAPFVTRLPKIFREKLALPSTLVEFTEDKRVFSLTSDRERGRLLVGCLFLGHTM
jgi:hypothetical protein